MTYSKLLKSTVAKTQVHCPICTHTVRALAVIEQRRSYVKPGQGCSHCGSTLDAGHVLNVDRAA